MPTSPPSVTAQLARDRVMGCLTNARARRQYCAGKISQRATELATADRHDHYSEIALQYASMCAAIDAERIFTEALLNYLPSTGDVAAADVADWVADHPRQDWPEQAVCDAMTLDAAEWKDMLDVLASSGHVI